MANRVGRPRSVITRQELFASLLRIDPKERAMMFDLIREVEQAHQEAQREAQREAAGEPEPHPFE
jgi:DNA repair exonuclease SbcCD ATPase subunit